MSEDKPTLRAVHGDPGDPLERRKRFEAEHPEITIKPPGPGHPWWTAHRDSQQIASAYQLSALMDKLTGEDIA